MNYATLLTSFPAAIAAACTAVASGALTSGTVYVADEGPRPAGASGYAVWVRPDPEQPVIAEEIASGQLVAYRFHCLFYGEAVTDADLRAFVAGMRGYFHGLLPTTLAGVTDLVATTVVDMAHDVNPGQGGATGAYVVLDAIGKEFPS